MSLNVGTSYPTPANGIWVGRYMYVTCPFLKELNHWLESCWVPPTSRGICQSLYTWCCRAFSQTIVCANWPKYWPQKSALARETHIERWVCVYVYLYLSYIFLKNIFIVTLFFFYFFFLHSRSRSNERK